MMLKKVLTAGLAGIITAVSATCSVSALTPPSSYDVTGDGTVNISDVVAINLFLSGSHTSTNVSRFDANQNGIVDELDSKSVMAYCMETGIPTITMI